MSLATVLLGDRVEARAGRPNGREIVLDLLRAGPDDPLCCPSLEVTVSWELDDGQLVQRTSIDNSVPD